MRNGEVSASIDFARPRVRSHAFRSGESPNPAVGFPGRTRFGVIGRQRPRPDVVPEDSGFHDLERLLPRQYFLWQIHREKRRVERSGAPLSIAMFHLTPLDGEVRREHCEALLTCIGRCRRETDIVGSLGEGAIAVLLPDTAEQGAQVLADRVVKCAGALPVSAVSVTYPDQIFDKLQVESQGVPDFSPLSIDEFPAESVGGYGLKRGLDLLGALFALIVFSPVMLVAALAVALTSPGPVIFKQVRIGRNGKPFVFYKFRSMYRDADDRLHKDYVTKLINGNLAEINEGTEAQPFYKMKSDPRVTRVGKFIRQTHIDELPQFFNVLKGDMSLVGPRPPLPYEVEKYQPWHLRRILEIKPGITGLWQVDGHNTTTFDEMVRIDLRYMRTCSLWLDVSILLRTVKVVLERVFA